MPGIKKSRVSTGWLIIIKLVVLVAVASLIYGKISDPHNFGEQFVASLNEIRVSNKALILLTVVLILLPLNWYLEACKWHTLSSPVAPISIKQAYVGVLSGLTMGFATPHGIGDYAGRIWQIDAENRGRLVGGVWLGKVAQMIMTMVFGAFGVLVYVRHYHQSQFVDAGLLIKLVVVVLVAGLLLLGVVLLVGWKAKILNGIKYYFGIALEYPKISLMKVGLFSLLRYTVFTFQFFLVMLAVGIKMPYIEQVAGITWVFLIKSVIPSFNFLSDLGIREYSALTFFENYSVNQASIIVASLIVWIINILFPVIIGLVFILKMKIKRP